MVFHMFAPGSVMSRHLFDPPFGDDHFDSFSFCKLFMPSSINYLVEINYGKELNTVSIVNNN